MALPFTADQFFSVFAAYNETVWPAQVVLFVMALVMITLALRGPWRAKLVSGMLASLWVWMGVAYFWAFFARINPAARVFGALFVVQGVLFLWHGVRGEGILYHPRSDVGGWLGAVLAVYALVLYPALGYVAGHRYPAQPTFGLPCPTTIFTVGLLLWARSRVPWSLLIIPALWSVIGLSAVRLFGVWEDVALPIAALGGGAVVLWQGRANHLAGSPLSAASREGRRG